MHELSIGAIFKNEERNMREWLDHYLHHGVEHFYLIDDGNTDCSAEVLKPYTEAGLATVYYESHPYYLGRQYNLYNKHVLPYFAETHWLLMVDLDELVWSPRSTDLREVLRQLDHIAQIQMTYMLFGSSGHDADPKGGLVASYTRRAAARPTHELANLKYFLNSTRANCAGLGLHTAVFSPKEGKDAPYYIMDETWVVLNHYRCQSREFWRNVKCTRGDADNYRVRTMEDFNAYDFNDVEDTRLLEMRCGRSTRR